MKYTVSQADIERTVSELPEHIFLQDRLDLTKERAERAIRASLGKRVVSTNRHDPVRLRLMLSSDRSVIGVVLNEDSRRCNMEGCTGRRQYVVWEDGMRTFPCSKGCECIADHVEKIC